MRPRHDDVTEKLVADAQHHRPVASNQRREGSLTGRATAVGNVPLQKLAISQPPDRAPLEERLKLSEAGSRCRRCHNRLFSC